MAEHPEESLPPTQTLAAEPAAGTDRDSSSLKSNVMVKVGRVSTAMALPPEDLDEAREWTRQNPTEAMAWLTDAPTGEQRDAVAEIVCATMAQFDPAQAVSLAEHFSGGNMNLLENMVQQWADQDEPAAYEYAINRPSGEERDHLLSRVAFARSRDNPIEAAKLVAEQMAPGEAQNEAAISVLHQWALHDPNAALAWAQLFSDQGLRARAVAEVETFFLVK